MLKRFKKKQTVINTTDTEYEDTPEPKAWNKGEAYVLYVKGESIAKIAERYGLETKELIERLELQSVKR